MADDLTLMVAGRTLSGWTDIRVTRGIERCPNDFEVGMTELFPGEAKAITVQPGDDVQVYLGQDLVVTGYVDTFMPSIQPGGHAVRVSGRGRCQDLVDCSALWPGGQITGNTVFQIASKLAEPYQIKVIEAAGVELGGPIPKFNLVVTDSPWNIIEQICRYRALLAFENAAGQLVLSGVGNTYAGSGFEEGVNVQAATFMFSMAQRFSQYELFLQGMETLDDLGQGGNLLATVKDVAVPRFRNRALVAETAAGVGGLQVSLLRASWEFARRIGRSTMLRVTADSWRDTNRALWQPNTLVPLSLPSMKLDNVDWLIGEVTYLRSAERGTTAELVLMPPIAFIPEPVVFQPLPADAEAAARAAGL